MYNINLCHFVQVLSKINPLKFYDYTKLACTKLFVRIVENE